MERFFILTILFGFSVVSCFSFSIADQNLFPKNYEPSSKVHLCVTPLIGGPRFLPLHFQLVLDREVTKENQHDNVIILDFIPKDATDKRTLASLITGQSVDGEIRCMTKPRNKSLQDNGYRWIVQTWEIPLSYEESKLQMSTIPAWYNEQFSNQLSLVENNCLKFALLSLQKLKGGEKI